MASRDVVVSDTKLLFKHMEIPASYYGITGHLPLWSISKLYQDTGIMIRGTSFMDTHIFPKGNVGFFIIREKIRFFPDVLRKMSYHKRLHYSTMHEFVAFGNSTNTVKSSIVIEECNDTLCENYGKRIFLDITTKRPLEYPSWFKEKYKNQMKAQHLEKVSIFDPPRNSFQKNMEVCWSDSDFNGHANASTYYKFMIDCASAASTSGYYRHFSLDMAWYPVREVDVSILAECKANDIISTFTWQEENDIEKIHFAMSVKKKYVFQGTAIFETTAFRDVADSKL